jgi:opacity protein-like surface antigen
METLSHPKNVLIQCGVRVALASLLACPLLASAGDGGKSPVPVESPVWEKPAWLMDLSLGVKESYDSNVFLAGAGIPTAVPQGTVGYRNVSAWSTTVSPKIGVNFVPLLGEQDVFKVLSLGYVPDFVIFPDVSSESYSSQRFTTSIKAQVDPVTLSLDNAFTYIDGDNEGVIYPDGASSFTNGTVRERRDQWQDRLKASVKIDLCPVFFVRPVVSLTYYDLATKFENIKGYTNYVDRYDFNGGADLGFNVTKDVALLLGYRYGHQYQEALPVWIDAHQYTATNDYQRVLFGVEGKPLSWLKLEGYVGPEFKTYTGDRPTTGADPASLIDKNSADVYGEASVTVTPTASDALVFKYKRWNWVSSTGRNAYLDSLYDASYRHQLTKALQLELGARAGQADYNPSALRNDWDYTFSAGLRYAVTANLSVDVSYAYDMGRDDEDAVAGNWREFYRNVVTTGAQWKF